MAGQAKLKEGNVTAATYQRVMAVALMYPKAGYGKARGKASSSAQNTPSRVRVFRTRERCRLTAAPSSTASLPERSAAGGNHFALTV
jgi:hypothetical protein